MPLGTVQDSRFVVHDGQLTLNPPRETRPWLVVKLLPLMVNADPGFPVAGVSPVITGPGKTVNGFALLANEPTVTITFPDVAVGGGNATI